MLNLFVDALNQRNYAVVFNLLDPVSQAQLGNPEQLQAAYTNALSAATVLSTTTRVGDVTLQDNTATSTLITAWHSNLIGTFETTSTVQMTSDERRASSHSTLVARHSSFWQVSWTRDTILPGFANGRLFVQRTSAAPRGAIYFADGSLVAGPTELTTIGVQRGALQNQSEEATMLNTLSLVTGLSADAIREKYKDQPEDWFVPIAELTEEQMALNSAALQPFKAIGARRSYTRAYTQTRIAPHVVGWVGAISPEAAEIYKARGYTGDEQVGVTGIEAAAEQTLAGQPEISLQLVAEDGSIRTVARRNFVRAQDLTLTISPTLQTQVQNLLSGRVGAAVVMDVRDGAVLAMASFPTFDANAFTDASNTDARASLLQNPRKPLLNRAAQTIYPPGSVFKMVTMAAGIEEGVSFAEDSFLDRGYWDVLGREYRKTCWLKRGHGRINLQNGLSASCDIVFYDLGKRLDDKGQNLLPDYARKFGFGETTGIELSGEAAGVLPGPQWKQQNVGEVWTTGDAVNMSIGQGYVLASPLQVAQMTAAIANDGQLIRPHFIKLIGDAPAPLPPPTQLPASTQTLSEIQQGMLGVVNNARFGTTQFRFASFNYYLTEDGAATTQRTGRRLLVAGKSGTAQAPGERDKPFAWFTAYAPADDPQIAVTVLLENIGEGSVWAAPVARQILEAYFGLPISATPRDVRVSD
jgi:penicillin-binding protein 2